MRLLFLVSGVNEVSCRFRVLQYLPLLRARGIDATVRDLHTSRAQRRRIVRSASEYDAVCVHRVFLSSLELAWLQRAGRRYVYDVDDAIMFRDSSRRRLESWQRRRRFARMVSGATVVIAGNGYLRDLAARHNPRVAVIPTALDLTPYPRAPAASAEPVIGWIGTRANLMYLREALPALVQLMRHRPEVKLKIVSDGAIEVPGVRVIVKPWSLADEVQDLRSFRVGIMPLPDDRWTRGKCALKILQYFAAYVPVVCAPVGANLEVVQDGQNGRFARTEEEWVAGLEELLDDTDRHRQFGIAGRATVERAYCVDVQVGHYVRALLGQGPALANAPPSTNRMEPASSR